MADIDARSLAALGLTGVAVWQVHGAYTASAPPLTALRDSNRDTTAARQALMDCDILVGVLVIASGGLAWYVTDSPVPAIIVLASYLLVAGYHHLILHGPTVGDIETGDSSAVRS